MVRRTKIVATLGPATDPPEILEAILRAGVDVARVNFSHGATEEHLARVTQFREAARRVGKFVAVMADLPGPKLRVKIPEPRELHTGETVTFSMTHSPVEPDDFVITEPEMLADVRPGQRMLLDDGRFQLEAGEAVGGRLAAKVTVGGTLKPNKGLNLPETRLSLPALTQRDYDSIGIAARAAVDWVAVSFVRGAEAAHEVRGACRAAGLDAPVLAKIERPEAVGRAGSIVAAFNAIMVARGDLGVELPLECVPAVQKQLIAEARAAGKPVITATEMLDSMKTNPRPTRAEAGDVANAIYEGTDAVMLSGETAVGSYPVEAVACMHRIAVETESHMRHRCVAHAASYDPAGDEIDHSITLAACSLANEVNATAIVTPTLSGRTARLVSRYRPWAQIVAVAQSERVLQRLALVWGITPVRMTPVAAGSDRMVTAIHDAFAAGTVKAGERVVVLAGHPAAGGPRFPTIRLVRIGENGEPGEP